MAGCAEGCEDEDHQERHDDAGTLTAAASPADVVDRCRPTNTMAALQARIARKPTHCSASPMPSPQYGLDGPISTGMPWKKVKVTISTHATTTATRAAARWRR